MDVAFAQKLYIIESRKEGEVAIMLIQFNFKNFKSFRDEATLDLSASKMTEFSDRVVTVGSEKILPVAAIYGANASGKSNIYNAFEYMLQILLSMGMKRKSLRNSGLLRSCSILHLPVQNPVLKFISPCRAIRQREHIIMVFALTRKE